MMFTLFSALMGLAVAAPSVLDPRTVCSATQRDANFDDLTGVPASELNPIPVPYMGLFYQGFEYSQVLAAGTGPGVQPHSGTNYAVASVVTELNGTPMFTVNYPNSTVKSFDLQNFYFGCVLNEANAVTSVPTQCNIEITGYIGSDNSISNAYQVCARQFQYNPTSVVAVQQQAYSGPIYGCTGLSFVVVTFSLPGGTAALQTDLALVLDDIRYVTKTC